jgi:hypothetical protein
LLVLERALLISSISESSVCLTVEVVKPSGRCVSACEVETVRSGPSYEFVYFGFHLIFF